MEANNDFGASIGAGKLQYSLEAEQSVLGSILIDSACMNKVADILVHADYFYLANHKIIYSTMLDMFTIGMPIDYITVLDKIKTNDELDHSHFKEYLLKLAQIVPTVSNVEFYADIVRDKYNVRVLVDTAKEIIDDASGGEVDATELLNSAEQKYLIFAEEKTFVGFKK